MAYITVQTDVATFLQEVEADAVSGSGMTAENFRSFIASAVLLAGLAEVHDQFLCELSFKAQVARSTISRWVRGAANPDPTACALFVRDAAAILRQLVETPRQSAA